MTNNVKHLFLFALLICHLCLFGEVSVQGFSLFFNGVVCFLIVLRVFVRSMIFKNDKLKKNCFAYFNI